MLEVHDIHTYYGDSYVLQGVSLKVMRGQISVLMGRNGVGKTTTMRSIVGLTPARRGSVVFDGEELTRLPTHKIAQRGIGLVPQGRRVFASLTVREHLDAAASSRRGETWSLDRIFDAFPRLRERQQHRAMHLSGGEQTMLAIARALRTEPRCLLMDEPTEGLAPMFVEIVVGIVQELKATDGLGMLIVVHELPIALAIADHIYVMGKGRLAFEGSPREFEQRRDIQERYIGVGV
jgi:branched-chain amino acid transport system ATP-binding protein